MRAPIAEQVFGANKAPLEEVLAHDFADLAGEVERAEAALTKQPAKIKDDADLAVIGSLATRAKALTAKLEKTRKDETDPLHHMQKAVKAHFDALSERVSTALAPLLKEADRYANEKVARERREREEAARKIREQEEAERKKAEDAKRPDTAARAESRADAFANQADQLEAKTVSTADAVRTRIAGGGVATASEVLDFEIEDYDAIDLNKLRPYLKRDAVETAIRSAMRVQKKALAIPGVRVFERVKAQFR